MFVCVCKAVRSSEISEVIQSGANTVEAVGNSCGAGTDCGSCVRRIQRAIDAHVAHTPSEECATPQTLSLDTPKAG